MADKCKDRLRVPKKQDDMAGRLQTAALELFGERGYDRTTAAEIASRAGVTERTFFRYFPDKREVLFGGQAVVLAALTASVANMPAGLGPLEMLFSAFRSIVPMLEANRSWLMQRDEIIAATPALREREITKMAAMGGVLAEALGARGVPKLRAILAARICMTTFELTTSSWLNNPAVSLGQQLRSALREVKTLSAETASV